MWTTYCHDFEEDFQLIFMNHIHLLIRNQCGSHIIHEIPNPLAFQQNYSRYDGPSESGSFFTLSKQGLTSFLLKMAIYILEFCGPILKKMFVRQVDDDHRIILLMGA